MRAARGPRASEELCRGLTSQDAGLGVVFLWEAEARGIGRGLSGLLCQEERCSLAVSFLRGTRLSMGGCRV